MSLNSNFSEPDLFVSDSYTEESELDLVCPSQGCSKAFMGVVSLNNVLRCVKASSPLSSDFSKKFFSEQFKKIDYYWCAAKYVLILPLQQYVPQGKQQG